MKTTSDDNLVDPRNAGLFEERAEHLPREQLKRWTALTDRERKAVSKLKGPGAKLLIGPRGSGKSTLMRLAFYELMEDSDALPIYVNYARHLALEPMFHSRPEAVELFRQWVLCKIVIGCAEVADELSGENHELSDQASAAHRFVEGLETGRVDETFEFFSPTHLSAFLNEQAITLGRKRVVLLLDDAAHAFSIQQQREFFEIFRQLRSRSIAPKAAVYPGVTNYSSNMHIGHDAELVEAWYRAEDTAFFDTMNEMAQKRLPSNILQEFGEEGQLLRFLALASFGLPRSFLTMIQDVLGFDEEEGTHSRPTRIRAERAVARNAENIRQVFASTGTKIPRYSNLISAGQELENELCSAISKYNANRDTRDKTITVGFRQPITRQFQQVLDLMAYAGILRRLETLSRGSAGVFERYELHSGLIIDTNSLSLGRSSSIRDIVTSLTGMPTASLVRSKAESLLGREYLEKCTLNLTPCASCGAARVNDDAQFCMKCGQPLTEKSVYEEILRRPIEDLPIPQNKKTALARTSLKSIQDVLLDREFKELLRGQSIGPVWAKRIQIAAEEYVSV